VTHVSSETVVVKCGGAVAVDAVPAVLDLVAGGLRVCLVHGAGPQISEEMERFGIPIQFVRGRRVTTTAGLAVVRSSLAAVNRALCAALGARAVGLLGDEIGLHAAQVPELGLVGDPLPSRPPAIVAALDSGRLPVVAPIAVGPLNVNADEAAAALAVGLGASRLVFLTDVPGLLQDGAVVERIAAGDAARLLDEGAFEGGIVPKLEAAVTAARRGIASEIGATAVVA
jgi:acetylglutamate kinase